jgi:hypothetical protein
MSLKIFLEGNTSPCWEWNPFDPTCLLGELSVVISVQWIPVNWGSRLFGKNLKEQKQI